MKDTVRISVAIDYGEGNVVQHAFNVQLEQKPQKPQKAPVAVKLGDMEIDTNGKVSSKPKRKEFQPEFHRFLVSGDISEIKAMPDHRTIFKPCVFAQIYGIKGRTVYANKPTRVNNKYVGILPAEYFDDDLINEIKQRVDNEETINVVFLDDGSKPSIIHDIALVENWSALGYAFNSLYRQPKNV